MFSPYVGVYSICLAIEPKCCHSCSIQSFLAMVLPMDSTSLLWSSTRAFPTNLELLGVVITHSLTSDKSVCSNVQLVAYRFMNVEDNLFLFDLSSASISDSVCRVCLFILIPLEQFSVSWLL